MTVYLLVQYINGETEIFGAFSSAERAMTALPDLLGVEDGDLASPAWTPGPDGVWDRWPFQITAYAVDEALGEEATDDVRRDVFSDAVPRPNTAGTIRFTSSAGKVVDVQFGPGLRSQADAEREAAVAMWRQMQPGQTAQFQAHTID